MKDPSGANNYVKWRRSIDEHLELRRLTWNEYGMFSWFCTKASPQTGTLRTSWPMLAAQTGLSPTHVEALCRGLRTKRYISYPAHRGARRRLVEVVIDKFPLADGTYTRLDRADGRERADLPSELPSDLPSEFPSELEGKKAEESGTSLAGRSRSRSRKRKNPTLRVRSADTVTGFEGSLPEPDHGQDVTTEATASSSSREPSPGAWDQVPPARVLTLDSARAQLPAVLHDTVRAFLEQTGRPTLADEELDALARLEAAHTPAVIQKAIAAAVQRFARQGRAVTELTLHYVWESLQHFTTRKPPTATGPRTAVRTGTAARDADPYSKYPVGLTRLSW